MNANEEKQERLANAEIALADAINNLNACVKQAYHAVETVKRDCRDAKYVSADLLMRFDAHFEDAQVFEADLSLLWDEVADEVYHDVPDAPLFPWDSPIPGRDACPHGFEISGRFGGICEVCST